MIPGIDDGVQTIEESLSLISQLADLGYKKLITTPHIMRGGFNNTPEIINAGLTKMRNAVKSSGINISLEAAAEYYFDEFFIADIEKQQVMTFGNKYVLFELPASVRPSQLEKAIFSMNTSGYQPVLAHPERYIYMHEKSLENYRTLKNFGLFFQINMLSLIGYYSKPVQQIARRLIDAGMVDFIGSDMHSQKHTDQFKVVLHDEYFIKLSASKNLLNNSLITD